MPKFPEPNPDWLLAIGPEIVTVSQGSEWWRIYFAGGAHPTTWNSFHNFGPVLTARFDHHFPPPAVQARSVLYAASAGTVCVAEVFQDTRRIHFEREPRLAAFKLVRDVNLLDMTDLWPTRAGASQSVACGPRARAQRWACTIANIFDVEGILYRSSMHGGDRAIALWDCRDVLPPVPDFDEQLADNGLSAALQRCGGSLGYSIATP